MSEASVFCSLHSFTRASKETYGVRAEHYICVSLKTEPGIFVHMS